MAPGAVRSINLALADTSTARPIVLLAPTPVDAVYAAGIEVTQIEEEFLRKIPGAMWTDIKAHMLAAFAADQTPEISIEPAGSYGLVRDATRDNVVPIVIRGPVPNSEA